MITIGDFDHLCLWNTCFELSNLPLLVRQPLVEMKIIGGFALFICKISRAHRISDRAKPQYWDLDIGMTMVVGGYTFQDLPCNECSILFNVFSFSVLLEIEDYGHIINFVPNLS